MHRIGRTGRAENLTRDFVCYAGSGADIAIERVVRMTSCTVQKNRHRENPPFACNDRVMRIQGQDS